MVYIHDYPAPDVEPVDLRVKRRLMPLDLDDVVRIVWVRLQLGAGAVKQRYAHQRRVRWWVGCLDVVNQERVDLGDPDGDAAIEGVFGEGTGEHSWRVPVRFSGYRCHRRYFVLGAPTEIMPSVPFPARP